MTPDELRLRMKDYCALSEAGRSEYQRIMDQLANEPQHEFVDFVDAWTRRKWRTDPATGIASPEGRDQRSPFAGIADLMNSSAGSYWGADPTALTLAPQARWSQSMSSYMVFSEEAEEPPALRVDPDVKTEVVYGYRSFIVNASQNLSLRAVTNGIMEYPRFQRIAATCTMASTGKLDTCHNPPGANCTCGIYAVRDANQVAGTGGSIFAKVALWGRIIVCSGGYRAQYAYPQTLYLTGKNDEVVRAIAPLYGCSMEKMP